MAAIAFTPAPASNNPNLKSSTNDQALRTFHNLVQVCFASIRRWNPSTKLVLVTTSDPGSQLRGHLEALDVSILSTTFDHRPPAGFYPSFNASLFSVDAMAALARRFDADDRIVLLDPDVICTRSLDSVFDSIQPVGFLAYDTRFPCDEVSQGLSARAAGALHRELNPSLVTVPRHYGGELYGFSSEGWRAVVARVEEAWSFSLAQWRRGLPRFVTEEHLLNYALRHTEVHSAEEFIRRIWTAPTYRTVRPMDLRLSIWHLPAEKRRGLATLHKHSLDRDSWFWQAPDQVWRRRAAGIFGIPHRPPRRWARDTASRYARRTQRVLSRDGLRSLVGAGR